MKKISPKKPLNWYKDKKLLTGVILVLLSFILGSYGKALFIVKFYEPVQVITGLSIWAFSFLLLFLGAFLVGWETIRLIHQRIHDKVKTTVKKTYHHAKRLPQRGYRYTKKLHKKSIEKIKKSIQR